MTRSTARRNTKIEAKKQAEKLEEKLLKEANLSIEFACPICGKSLLIDTDEKTFGKFVVPEHNRKGTTDRKCPCSHSSFDAGTKLFEQGGIRSVKMHERRIKCVIKALTFWLPNGEICRVDLTARDYRTETPNEQRPFYF